jgi:predicted esterase
MLIDRKYRARLAARPGSAPLAEPLAPGLGRLDGGGALVFAPEAAGPVPLVVLLHGATQQPDGLVAKARPHAERLGFAILAPKARSTSWDLMREGGFGPDVAALDALLRRVFGGLAVDPARLAIGGFSDGASYALSLGLQNGDLFGDILAFSAGFMVAPETHGHPRIFISHGRQDEVLPIDRCGRALARQLVQADYDVVYQEFDGGHTLPPDVLDAGVRRFLGRAV